MGFVLSRGGDFKLSVQGGLIPRKFTLLVTRLLWQLVAIDQSFWSGRASRGGNHLIYFCASGE